MTKRARLKIPKQWSFKRPDVAGQFDAHVREQLPWYDLATNLAAHVARHYLPEGGLVYDIGASTGNIGRALGPTIEARRARLIPIEPSEDMARRYAGPGHLVIDSADDYEFKAYDVAVLFLTLMFVPVARRADLIRRLRDKLRPGGCIVVFDKCLPGAGYPAIIKTRLALEVKLLAQVAPDEILSKELSLVGVQRPIDPAQLLPEAVEIFRFGDFAGWVMERAG